MPATNEPAATTAEFFKTVEGADMMAAYFDNLPVTASDRPTSRTPQVGHGGGGGGGGPRTGTVMGGKPGICTTVDPTNGGGAFGSNGGMPAGGGGGGGGMPLLTWIVMIEPGTVCPAGEVPTTAPAGETLLTGVACSATWKPASLRR